MSYYKTNCTLLFRLKGEFEQHFTLTEIEDMTPFERSVYLIQMEQKRVARENEKQSKKSKR